MIYDKIKELCKNMGISVNQVEKKLNFSNGMISKWGKSEPTATNLKKVADFFGKPIEYFLE